MTKPEDQAANGRLLGVGLLIAVLFTVLAGFLAATVQPSEEASAQTTDGQDAQDDAETPSDEPAEGTDDAATDDTTTDDATDDGPSSDAADDATTDDGTSGDAADDATTDGATDDTAQDGAADDGATKDEPAETGKDGGGRTDGLTRDLKLSSATVESLDLQASDEEYVIFTFEDNVNELQNETGFIVRGKTEDGERNSVSARLVRDENNQVLVGFEDGTDLDNYSIASVETDTVRDESDEGNPFTTVELGGADGDESSIAGPSLESVTVNETLNRIEYTFDADLDADATSDASAFGYRTMSGREETGAEIVDVDDENVAVDFDSAVEDAERIFVSGGAATDEQGVENPPASLGGDTASPELTSVERVGDRLTEYDFSFSDDVASPDPALFEVYDESGDAYPASDWSRVDADTVRLYFPDTRDFGDEIVLGATEAGAVTDNGNGSDITNTLASQSLDGGEQGEGPTDGPDLLGTVSDAETGEVVFEFDEALDEDQEPDPSQFQALTMEGDLVEGRHFVEIGENSDTAIITFDSNIAAAAEDYIVEPDAVTDYQGHGNPGGLG